MFRISCNFWGLCWTPLWLNVSTSPIDPHLNPGICPFFNKSNKHLIPIHIMKYRLGQGKEAHKSIARPWCHKLLCATENGKYHLFTLHFDEWPSNCWSETIWVSNLPKVAPTFDVTSSLAWGAYGSAYATPAVWPEPTERLLSQLE